MYLTAAAPGHEPAIAYPTPPEGQRQLESQPVSRSPEPAPPQMPSRARASNRRRIPCPGRPTANAANALLARHLLDRNGTMTFIAESTHRDFVGPWNVRTSGKLRADIGGVMRSHVIERDTAFPVRQICAYARATRTTSATQLLSATHIRVSRSSINTPTKSPWLDPIIGPSNADRSLARRTRNGTRIQSRSLFPAPCCTYLRSNLLSVTATRHPIAIGPGAATRIRVE